MSNDRRIRGGEGSSSVLREDDLAWLARVAKDEEDLLILADEAGAPISPETLRRCLSLGVIEPLASARGIGFKRTERAKALLKDLPPDARKEIAELRALLDLPGSALALGASGGQGGLQRKFSRAAAAAMLVAALLFAGAVITF
jgi:hypothetical protein